MRLPIDYAKVMFFFHKNNLPLLANPYIKSRYLEIKLILCYPAMYILLDEPFNGLSPIVCEAIRKQIHTVSQSKGIILTDHNFREVHKIANRICLLDQGYLREIQDKNELRPYGYLKF